MWYDILVVCILLFFMARGAARGLVWQLAGIAGILLCVTFAGTASKVIGPQINLPPPQNQWAVMFITYLLATLVAFGFARTLTSWIDKLELKEFNRHLGAMFGLFKGALLVLVMTFMIVTFSENSRKLIQDSKAAHIAAKVIHQLEPVVPDKLYSAVSRYVDMFERTGFAQESVAPGEEVLPGYLGENSAAPQDGADLGQTSPFDAQDLLGTGQTDRTNNRPVAPPPSTVSSELLSRLQATLGTRVTDLVEQELGNVSPEVKARIEQSVTDALQSADARTRRQLQEHVIANGQPGDLVQLLDDWAGNFLSSNSAMPQQPASNISRTQPRNTQPPSAQPQYAPQSRAPQRNQPIGNQPSGQPSRTRQPAQQSRTPVNAPETQASSPPSILDTIAAAQTQFPSIQKKLKGEYQQVLQSLPRQVGQAVFEDWYGDLTNSQTDVDPDTTANTSLDMRIKRQLNAAGVSIDRLPPDLQERMRDFEMTAEGAGVLR